MSTASERTIQALEQVVKDVPVGTDLALVHLLWANYRHLLYPASALVHGYAHCGTRFRPSSPFSQ